MYDIGQVGDFLGMRIERDVQNRADYSAYVSGEPSSQLRHRGLQAIGDTDGMSTEVEEGYGDRNKQLSSCNSSRPELCA